MSAEVVSKMNPIGQQIPIRPTAASAILGAAEASGASGQQFIRAVDGPASQEVVKSRISEASSPPPATDAGEVLTVDKLTVEISPPSADVGPLEAAASADTPTSPKGDDDSSNSETRVDLSVDADQRFAVVGGMASAISAVFLMARDAFEASGAEASAAPAAVGPDVVASSVPVAPAEVEQQPVSPPGQTAPARAETLMTNRRGAVQVEVTPARADATLTETLATPQIEAGSAGADTSPAAPIRAAAAPTDINTVSQVEAEQGRAEAPPDAAPLSRKSTFAPARADVSDARSQSADTKLPTPEGAAPIAIRVSEALPVVPLPGGLARGTAHSILQLRSADVKADGLPADAPEPVRRTATDASVRAVAEFSAPRAVGAGAVVTDALSETDKVFVDPTETRAASGGHHQMPSAPPSTSSPPPVAASLHTLPQTLAAQVSASPTGGVEVILAPDELGSLQIHFRREGEGVHVTVLADRPDTLDLVRRSADLLAQELRQSGFSAATFSFGQSGQGQSRKTLPDTDQRADPAAALRPEPSAPARTTGSSAALDLRL